jgi:23S rRNA G2445 N2-methylase RlmL
VEIHGQQCPVESVAEATELLQRARALAAKQADERAVVATKKLKRKRVVPKVRIAAPVITVSPEIAVDVSPLIADIERLYRQAAETAELRLLLARQMREEDEDEAELLLLI